MKVHKESSSRERKDYRGYFSDPAHQEISTDKMLHNMGDVNRILVVFSVALLIYANPALSQLGELMPKVGLCGNDKPRPYSN